jgi:hypothetical protein
MKMFGALAVAVATVGLGSGAAMAQTMSTAPTMVCRVAATGETSNSMMGSVALICKKYDFDKAKRKLEKMMMEEEKTSDKPTQAQIDAAYQKAYGDMNLLGQHN